MKRILAVVAVFAALLMMSCGASAEEKMKIEEQSKKINTLEKTVNELQRTVNEQKAKSETPPTPAPVPAPGGGIKNPPKTK